jgi:HEAT repeat protein
MGPAAAPAVPALTKLLYHRSAASSAADALGEIGPPARAAVLALIRAMKDPDTNGYRSNLRLDATKAIGGIGPGAKAALPALIEALGDDWDEVSEAAVRSLARIGPASVPALVKALQNQKPEIRILAAKALGGIGPAGKAAAPALRKALNDLDDRAAVEAAFAYWKVTLEVKPALAVLLMVLQSNNGDAYGRACESLASMGPAAQPAVRKLCAHLETGKGIPYCAIQALRRIRPAPNTIVPALTRALGSKAEGVPAEAALALGEIGAAAKGAVKPLSQALKDPDAEVRRTAAGALGCIGPGARNAVPALGRALQDKNAGVRASAAFALGQIGKAARPAVPNLVAALGDSDWVVRWGSLTALQALGRAAQDAVPALAKLVKDKRTYLWIPPIGDNFYRRYRWTYPWKLNQEPKIAAPALAALARDWPATVPERAMRILARLGPAAKGAVPALLRALRDERGNVRRAARATLQKVDPGALLRARLSAGEQKSLWADLRSKDLSRATRAMWALAAAPTSTVPLLRDRLHPAAGATPERLARLIKALDDLRYPVRRKAQSSLASLEWTAEPALRKALDGNPSLEARQRIEKLLWKLKAAEISPDHLQALRATEVLEEIATPKARQVLAVLAKGAPGALLTREARRALGRLAKRRVGLP